MAKRKEEKRVHTFLHTSNVISITLCIITMGLLIATCLNAYFVNKQQARNIQKINELIIRISNDAEFTKEEAIEDIYLSYYNAMDQKATDSINIALSFFGFIFSLVTIINTIISIRMPKEFENKLVKADNRIKEVERTAREATNAAHYVGAVASKKTTKEKIDAITDVIDSYGDNSGDLYFERGFLYDDIKDYDSAKADYRRAKRAGGAEYTYHNSMGVLYANIMDNLEDKKDKEQAFKKAEKHYKKAIKLLEELEEKADYSHCNLACLYQDYAKALKGWSIIEKINSGDFSLSESSEEVQKYTKLALEEFDKAIYISEDYVLAYLNRGISYQEMGEDFYQQAYEDFQKCFEIDPEDKDVLKLLSEISMLLFQKTNDPKYYNVAKSRINKLCKEEDHIELLNQKFKALEPPKVTIDDIGTNKILAKIDERMADWFLEEAMEYKNDSSEYGNSIYEAMEHYKTSLETYKKLYSISKKQEYSKAIERIQDKISKIESPKP